MYAVGAAARWDERRNTSKVQPVPPDALPAAFAALDRLRDDDPALVRWILDGHPTLTEAEHFERFGVAHEARSRRTGGERTPVLAPVHPRRPDVAPDGPAPAARAHSPVAVQREDVAAGPTGPFVAPTRADARSVQHGPDDGTRDGAAQLGLGL